MGKLSDGKSSSSNYLKAEHIDSGRELQLVMDRIAEEKIRQDDGEERSKYVLYFQGKERGLVLNNVNIDVLIDRYGDDTEAMAGKSIVLYRTTTSFKNQTVPCLRLRAPNEVVSDEEIAF